MEGLGTEGPVSVVKGLGTEGLGPPSRRETMSPPHKPSFSLSVHRGGNTVIGEE